MSTHNSSDSSHEQDQEKREQPDTSKGYEQSDVRVSGVAIFLLALCFFAGVTALLAYGIGKAINAHMAKEDGPPNKWTKTVDVRPLGDMPSSPELQNKLAGLTQQFPTPRLQTDDGNQDVADLHAREDLLLDNYSWADASQGKVRIPIDRAMELIAQRGLPVAQPVEQAPLMTGDEKPTVAVPLTNGFARTGYELNQVAAQKGEAGRHQ
ncbi:MAG: hypothetical protein ABSE51_00815 [Terracidiphilus sp.]|jgi:hypothetical protein